MATVIVDPPAERDVLLSLEWYLDIAPDRAGGLTTAFEKACEWLANFPQLSARRVGEARLYALSVYPYNIWYRYDEAADQVHVLRFVHHRSGPVELRGMQVNGVSK